MKHFVLLFVISFSFGPLYSQVEAPGKVAHTNADISERLVELAFQNPDLEIADHQINIAKYHLKEAKGWWASSISLSFNANEFTIKRLTNKESAQPTQPGQYYPYYPFYNVGVNIPIGGFFSKPAATKAAREQVAVAQASRNSKYRQVRAAVLSAYEDYSTSKELLTLQSQLTESSYSDYLQARQKFRNGQIAVDDYNKAMQRYHDQLTNRIAAQHDLDLNKIQLESMIGVPLNNVLYDATGQSPAVQTPASDSLSNH
jgi:outer membrane protein TolC